jgi:hypothetical protein
MEITHPEPKIAAKVNSGGDGKFKLGFYSKPTLFTRIVKAPGFHTPVSRGWKSPISQETLAIRISEGDAEPGSKPLSKARPISCNDCPAFQRLHMSFLCIVESFTRRCCVINTTFSEKIYIRWCCFDRLSWHRFSRLGTLNSLEPFVQD